LMSPFKSLREVAKDHVGKILSYLLAERYRNVDLIKNSKCPVLIVHGKEDTTIGVSHSTALKEACGSSICKLVVREKMDHNTFNF
jgi:alpha-beta hydrolase superfamily lysophospholipase